jgi:hypothetical protein
MQTNSGRGQTRSGTLVATDDPVAAEIEVRLMRANRHAELKLTPEQLRRLAARNVAELLREYAREIIDAIRTAFGDSRLGEDQQPAADRPTTAPGTDDGDTSLFRKRLGGSEVDPSVDTNRRGTVYRSLKLYRRSGLIGSE